MRVFFPRYTAGQSIKFTHLWRGPFRILSKCFDVTYEVPCSPRGKSQIIDRIRAKECQTLENENVEDGGDTLSS